MEEKILIDMETLKAIVVGTRLNILKLLVDKKYTLTEIAETLNLKSSTVKEHLDILEKAGLVSKEDTERKWKYYSLTQKGRRLVQPKEVKVLFAFIISSVATIGFSLYLISKFILTKAAYSGTLQTETYKAAVAEDSAMLMASAPTQAPAASPLWYIIVLCILIAISAFLLGYYLKKRVIIIER